MDDIDKHAQQHGYHIEDAVRGGNPGCRLIGGRRVFGERVRIFCAAPDRRSRPKVRRELYEEAKRRLANYHGRVDKSSQLNDRKRVEVAKAYESIWPKLGYVQLFLEEGIRIWFLQLAGYGKNLLNRDGNRTL